MVVFTCNHCGESVMKPKAEKHVTSCNKTRKYGNVSLCCVDCLKDFDKTTYRDHTKCLTELERYSGPGYVAKPSSNKGERKQTSWIECVKIAGEKPDLSKRMKSIFEQMSSYSNVPRNKSKFENFMRNSFYRVPYEDVVRIFELIQATFKESTQSASAHDSNKSQIATVTVKNDDASAKQVPADVEEKDDGNASCRRAEDGKIKKRKSDKESSYQPPRDYEKGDDVKIDMSHRKEVDNSETYPDDVVKGKKKKLKRRRDPSEPGEETGHDVNRVKKTKTEAVEPDDAEQQPCKKKSKLKRSYCENNCEDRYCDNTKSGEIPEDPTADDEDASFSRTTKNTVVEESDYNDGAAQNKENNSVQPSRKKSKKTKTDYRNEQDEVDEITRDKISAQSLIKKRTKVEADDDYNKCDGVNGSASNEEAANSVKTSKKKKTKADCYNERNGVDEIAPRDNVKSNKKKSKKMETNDDHENDVAENDDVMPMKDLSDMSGDRSNRAQEYIDRLTVSNSKFKWSKVVVALLSMSPNGEMSFKKLCRKTIALYESHTPDASRDVAVGMFNKTIGKSHLVKRVGSSVVLV